MSPLNVLEQTGYSGPLHGAIEPLHSILEEADPDPARLVAGAGFRNRSCGGMGERGFQFD